jgi:hypothetical protein
MISSAAASHSPISARKFAGRMSLSAIKAPSAVLRISLRLRQRRNQSNRELAVLKRNQRLNHADGGARCATNEPPFCFSISRKERPPHFKKST